MRCGPSRKRRTRQLSHARPWTGSGDHVRNEITTGKIPGAILLIQQHGKPVYFECFGVRDPATGQPMTPDSIFQIYSMSKAVTSVAAMMLVDDGKLALDDPVSKYIHAFADAKVGVDLSDEAGQHPLKLEPLKRPITIRDLLRHTSGITYGFFGETVVQKLYANPKLYAGDFDNAEFADRIATLPLADQPAVRWNYSHSTDVLGRVVEVASGQTLFQFEKQRLFDPLGMSETAYYVADEAKWPRIAQPFPVDRFRVAGIKDPTLPRRWESGGAGLVSTDRRLRPLPADAAERRRAGRQAVPQARDGRADDVGSDRAGDRDPSRSLLFPGPEQRLRSWLCRAHLTAAEYDMAARRIPLGRRGRQFLFRRSPGRPARCLHGAGPDARRADPAGAEDDDV